MRGLTLEGIDVEALVLPCQVCRLQSLLEGIPLPVIRGNDSIALPLFLIATGEMDNSIDLFHVLRNTPFSHGGELDQVNTTDLVTVASENLLPMMNIDEPTRG